MRVSHAVVAGCLFVVSPAVASDADLWSLPPAAPPALPAPEPPPSSPPRPAPPLAAPPGPTRTWYGSEVLGADALALSMFVVAAQQDSGTFAALGLGTYLLGGGVVHVVEGRGGTAVASVGLRAGAPIVGGALGLLTCTSGDGLGCLGKLGVGLLGGVVTAITIDAGVFAYKDVPPKQPTWSPQASFSKGRGLLGITGRF